MFVFNSSQQFDKCFSDKFISIGIVPTMGALHDGHLSLIKKALSENDKVLVTIFVNPTQFDDNLDLKSYPNELEKDLDKISQFGENISVFTPDKSDVYGDEIHAKQYDLKELDKASLIYHTIAWHKYSGLTPVIINIFWYFERINSLVRLGKVRNYLRGNIKHFFVFHKTFINPKLKSFAKLQKLNVIS